MGLFAKAVVDAPGLKFTHSDGFARAIELVSASLSTNSGKSLTTDRALRYSAYWGAVTILSQDVAKLPLHVYHEGTRRKATDHWSYRLLHRRPYPGMTSYRWRQTAMVHLLTWGNFYAGIGRDSAGAVVELMPLSPDRMEVRRDGGLVYVYTLGSGRKLEIPEADVFHVRGLSWDGITGYSILAQMREAVALGLSGEEYRARFFKHDARPGIVLSSKGKLSAEAIEHLTSTFGDKHEGVANSWRVAVLEEGVGVESVGIPPKDAQFLESQEFDVDVMGRWLRVPSYKLNSQRVGTQAYASVEQKARDYVTDSLLPWTENWQQEIDLQLLPDDLYSKLDLRGLLVGDTAARVAYYQAGLQGRWLTPNDVLELEDRDPVAWGDVPLSTPNNNAPEPA